MRKLELPTPRQRGGANSFCLTSSSPATDTLVFTLSMLWEREVSMLKLVKLLAACFLRLAGGGASVVDVVFSRTGDSVVASAATHRQWKYLFPAFAKKRGRGVR